MLDRDAGWLVEIETAAASIRAYTLGLDREAFLASSLTCAATAMQLIVIGEAAGRLSQTAKDEAPEITWGSIVSLRNKIAHGYSSIDHALVWSLLQNHLAALETAAHRMLAARGELKE